MARRKPGPVGKGPRTQALIRLPDDHCELYRQQAREQGLCLSDWLVATLAEHNGLEVPEYIRTELVKQQYLRNRQGVLLPRAG